MDKQTPLRDNYVSCTEPINPYHGNYVVISLSKPYCLNLPTTASNIWDIQSIGWENIGLYSPGSLSPYPPHWEDLSRNFIMPTHSVRTWSNCSYWWNPNHYYTTYLPLQPLSRSSNYVEPQIAGNMYMNAYLLGIATKDSMPYSYSQYNYTYSTGDSYSSTSEYTRPLYSIEPSQYLFINDYFTDSHSTPLNSIAGFNLTNYVVSFIYPKPDNSPFTYLSPPCFSNYLTIIIKPLVPYVDLSGCWLNPPANYLSYYYQDWDGYYILESKNGTQYSDGSSGEQIPILPAITHGISKSTRCFDVSLPVQLFTLSSVNSEFTFSLQDVSNGVPSYGPNMEVVATKVRGTFWDENGIPTNAGNANQVHFEILDPTSVFHISHTFEENSGNTNRPFYCTETNAIPIVSPASATTSILFSPKCGPGIWTNLPQDNL